MFCSSSHRQRMMYVLESPTKRKRAQVMQLTAYRPTNRPMRAHMPRIFVRSVLHPQTSIPKKRTFRTGITGGDEGDEGGPPGLLGGGERVLDPSAHSPSHGGNVWAHGCCCVIVFGVCTRDDTKRCGLRRESERVMVPSSCPRAGVVRHTVRNSTLGGRRVRPRETFLILNI